jgi:hypothetical protein
VRSSLAIASLLTLAGSVGASGQVVDDALTPTGRLRLELNPVHTYWESRFGRTDDGVTGREELGEDLTTPEAHTLYPGTESLRSAIESMAGLSGYAPVLGSTVGRVGKDVTRVELGASLGVFDWLTIGFLVPVTRTRSSVDVYFDPDTLGGDLGLSPVYSDPGAVDAFLQTLSVVDANARASAAQTCAASPGTPACASAQALADRTTSFHGSAQTAYDASPFFPIGSSTTATSLQQATDALNADLAAAGLPIIGNPMVFATEWVDENDFVLLPGTPQSGVDGEPLASLRTEWRTGDIEVSATARVLESPPPAPDEPAPRFGYSLLATFLGRLPTGQVDDPDVFLDVGTGDGQLDLEARLRGAVTIGSRIALLGGARYGIQMSRTLERRIAPPEVILAPIATKQLVEWTPGSYWGVEVAPGFRLSRELSIAAEYRAFRKYRDEYELTGPSVDAPLDPSVLEVESGITLHELGGTLRYDTVARVLGGEGGWPLQLHLRVQRAIAGGGGQTPVTTQVEFGARLFRQLWGR